MQDVFATTKVMNNILPPSPHGANIPMFPNFHINGIINTYCVKAREQLLQFYHQDNPLLA